MLNNNILSRKEIWIFFFSLLKILNKLLKTEYVWRTSINLTQFCIFLILDYILFHKNKIEINIAFTSTKKNTKDFKKIIIMQYFADHILIFFCCNECPTLLLYNSKKHSGWPQALDRVGDWELLSFISCAFFNSWDALEIF